MTEKQREAIKIVLEQCGDGNLDEESSLAIIEAIVDAQLQIQYIPYHPLSTDLPKPYDVTYKTTSDVVDEGFIFQNKEG